MRRRSCGIWRERSLREIDERLGRIVDREWTIGANWLHRASDPGESES